MAILVLKLLKNIQAPNACSISLNKKIFSSHIRRLHVLNQACLSHREPHFQSSHITSSQYHNNRRHFSIETLRHYYSPEFPPVGYSQQFLELLHDSIGLPWWGSILLATVVLRTAITLPASIYSQNNMIKLHNLGPELKENSERLRLEVASAMKHYKWDGKTAHFWYKKNMRRITTDMYERENCHPFKSSLVMWVQMPIWIGMSLALRNMSGRTPFNTQPFVAAFHPEMSQEGILWFTNLTLADPLFILPVVCGITNLLNTEIASLGMTNQTKLQKGVTYFFRFLSIIVIPIGIIMPSCMPYYWTCSSLYGLAQNLAMKHPRVKQLFGIAMTTRDSNTPYKDLWNAAKLRYIKPNQKS